MEHVALCRHEFDREQVVGSKPVVGHQPAEPAAERVARDTRSGDRPSGHPQAVFGGSVVQLPPDHTALGGGGCLVGIDRDRLHLGEVDHHTAFCHGATSDVVAAAADRDLESRPARERERGDDVVRRPAADDQSGPMVNEAVVHGTGRLVARVLRAKDGPGDLPSQVGKERGVQGCDHQLLPPRSGLAWTPVDTACVGTAGPDQGSRIGLSRRPWRRRTRVRTVATPLSFRSPPQRSAHERTGGTLEAMKDTATGQLLERSEELARIESALVEARAGRGTFVVIEGPAGIGKTALLAAARTAAADGGMRVLRSRGTELEREFAFGVVRQLFEPPLADASEVERADLLEGAAGVAAGLLGLPGASRADGAPTSAVDPSFATLHGLYWLCSNLAAAGPLCLMVDDAHWADAASLRYLAFLLTRIEELDAALVAATRPREAGTDAELFATVTSDPSADVIRLPPLTRAAVAQLVETRLAGVPDAVFVDACLRATRGTPFLMRVLVEALTEGGIAPTAEAAHHVERIGARTVGRSIRLRLRRLPEHAGRLARALAVLEQSDLLQAARLAGLEEVEAAEAAELLTTAGIVESGRPLTFVHPIVRSGIYSELSTAERGRGHRRAAQLLAEQGDANERVAKHLLVSEPAADPWVVERLVDTACAAGKQGAPESEAVFLRRALAEPPPLGDRSALLLDLGMADASVGVADWPDHLQQAVDTAPNAATAAEAAMVLGLALSRAGRFAEGVEVLDRAASSLDPDHSELGLLLEAAAVVSGMNDPVTASSVAVRREALRERATGHPAPPPELLAAAAVISVLTNEPAEVGADLAIRALAGESTRPRSDGRPWFAFATWFSQATVSLLWAERHAQVRPLLDASIAQARATGDSSRLAVGLAHRGWLALRRGDLI